MKEAIHEALGHEGKHKVKAHTHSIHYERADNGGFHARVEKRDHEGHPHKTEHHILPDMESAQAHMDEHMGDQPAAGEMPPPPDEEAGEQAPQGAQPPPQANAV